MACTKHNWWGSRSSWKRGCPEKSWTIQSHERKKEGSVSLSAVLVMSREHSSEGCTSDITLKVTRSRLTSVHDELATLIVTSRCCQSGVAIKCCTCKIPFSKSEQLTLRQFYILLLHVSVHLIHSGSLSVLTALYLRPNFNFTWRDMSKQIGESQTFFHPRYDL